MPEKPGSVGASRSDQKKPGSVGASRSDQKKPTSLMRQYADDALDMLFTLAEGAESEAVRVSAIKELLDRGFGKSGVLTGADSEPALTRIERVIVHAGAGDRALSTSEGQGNGPNECAIVHLEN